MPVKEEFLHYIWKYKLYKNQIFKDSRDHKIEIIDPGIHNFDSGPDFFNAKIKMDNTIWAGNVEVHVKSSDWNQHKHHKNKAYDNVILQVVYKNDSEIYNSSGQIIPTLELEFDKRLLEKYESLIKSESWIACDDEISKIDDFTISSWIEKLSFERLEEKTEYIKGLLSQTTNSWESSFYIHLARNFGFKLNADPFELLARSLPINYLAKHKDNSFQIEALLFGQAGFLSDPEGDEYYNNLRNEYLYLVQKFNLKPIENHLWKFLRSRPGNFPTMRIAQFASLVFRSTALFSKILEIESIHELTKLFDVKASDYWNTHYVFNKESINKIKILGKSAIEVLLINTVIPFIFVYGKLKGVQELQEKALRFLEQVKPEQNSIIEKWNKLGITPKSAFETQALIQLKNKYCNAKKCLNCQIGNSVIRTVK